MLSFLLPVYLYLSLFRFPWAPIYLDGDQTFFWEYALRMLQGEHIYRDFFQFTPPGTDLVFLQAFRLFGPHIWVLNAVVLLLGTALAWMCFKIARRWMDQEAALLATAIFAVIIYGRLLDATHHWFSLLSVLCGVQAVLPARTSARIAIAGAFFGIASFFTQTAGVAGVAALLCTLLWEHAFCIRPLKKTLVFSAVLVGTFLAVLGALSAHFLAEVGWRTVWYFQATYPRKYIAYRHNGILPGGEAWRRISDLCEHYFFYFLPAAIYPLTLWRCWKDRDDKVRTPQVLLLAMTGSLLYLVVAARTNWTRVYTISLPAVILLIYSMTRHRRLRSRSAGAVWVLIACLATGQTALRYRHNGYVTQLPAGRVALSKQKFDKFVWLASHTKPGDYLLQALWLNLYLPLELRSPVFVDGLLSGEVTRPEFVDLSVRQLKSKRVKYIVLTPWIASATDPPPPWENHLGPFEDYVHNHYSFVYRFPDQDEVWQLREDD
ncbi:hypothetical protein HNQ77_004562 [Silvibacterium bohemicum]|uniref:Glycosyltransferase RgtA/B/C/D-like domain-containing protein n=1 Tax=Silvibacterium bohemicum TaxID=1577686 RepID=A0A841JYP2_9BACT|nr:glycosyltransferase family 39 protein [Silvibacterium bohemicum]MBB6146583.1 hypothetical protein [Silvibacterium bohemicum]